MGGKVGGVVGTTLGDEFYGVDRTTIGDGTGGNKAMEYIHWPNRSCRYVIELSWAL